MVVIMKVIKKIKEKFTDAITKLKSHIQGFISGADKAGKAKETKKEDNHEKQEEQENYKKNEKNKKNKKSSSAIQNPYIKGAEGRQEWNDRYMNMAKAIRNWQMAFAVVAALAFVLILIVAKLATESKIKPYVVETNKGVPYAIHPVTGVSDKDQLLVNYAINQFVINARTIIDDTAAEKALLDKVYAYSAGNTMSFLQDYYAKNNPFDLAGDFSASVNIINALPIGNHTWQVIWEETKRSSSGGNVIGTTRWVGHFTYQFTDVNPDHITDNPFGIYITDVSWSKSQ